MRVLFWNTHKNKQINPVLLDLIKENEITFVALAEYAASTDELLQLLRQQGVPMEKYANWETALKHNKEIMNSKEIKYWR